jgi:hypothetical protein
MRLSISTVAISLLYLADSWDFCNAFHVFSPKATSLTRRSATVDGTNTAESIVKSIVLEKMSAGVSESKEYAEMFGLGDTDAGLYAFFDAIRQSGMALALKGQPFVLRNEEIVEALAGQSVFEGFFTMKDMEEALEDDFLDAARGPTDNRKGWKVRDKTRIAL